MDNTQQVYEEVFEVANAIESIKHMRQEDIDEEHGWVCYPEVENEREVPETYEED